MTITTRRSMFWVTGAAAALAFTIPQLAAADEFTMTSWGGAYQKSQHEAFVVPYMAKTGDKITEAEYSGEIAKIKAMVESGTVSWDVVDVDSATALQGCDDGIYLTIDFSKIMPKDKFVKGGFNDCAVGNIVYSTIFAYDADKLKDGPTKMTDFFDVAKFPGKRGMWKSPVGNLEFALIADGVPTTQLYEMLKTPAGVDRAFKKLDTIKKDVVWWQAGAQPPQLLASGEVVMTTAWNGRIYDADKTDGKHFKIVWDGQMEDFDYWVIPKGSKHVDAAYKFIAYASTPSIMATQSKWISYGPVIADAIPLVEKSILPDLPTAPENTKTAFVQDTAFWGENGEELRKRFNNWLAQ